MLWLRPAGLLSSVRAPTRRPGPERAPSVGTGKFHSLRRLGAREAEGSPGSVLERRGWLARNVLVTVLYFRLSVHFPLSTGSYT